MEKSVPGQAHVHSPILDEDAGEVCCRGCGVVLERDKGSIIGRKSEPYSDGSAVKHDAPLDLDVLAGTYVGNTNRDFRGKELTPKNKSHIKWISILDQRIKGSGPSKGIGDAISQIDKIGSALKMPDSHMREALEIYKEARSRKIPNIRPLTVAAAASVMCVVRKYEMPIDFNDVSRISDVKKKALTRSYRSMRREMDRIVVMESPSVSRYVSDILDTSDLSGTRKELYRREVMRNIGYLRERGYVASRKPSGVAAAAVFLTQKYDRGWKVKFTKVEIEGAVDCSRVTIRSNSEVFGPVLDELYSQQGAYSAKKDKQPTLI